MSSTEEYVQQHNLHSVLADQLESILKDKPKNLYRYLVEWATLRSRTGTSGENSELEAVMGGSLKSRSSTSNPIDQQSLLAAAAMPQTVSVVPPTLGVAPTTLGAAPPTMGVAPPIFGAAPTNSRQADQTKRDATLRQHEMHSAALAQALHRRRESSQLAKYDDARQQPRRQSQAEMPQSLTQSFDSEDAFVPLSPYRGNSPVPLVDRLQNLVPSSNRSPENDDDPDSAKKMDELNLDSGSGTEEQHTSDPDGRNDSGPDTLFSNSRTGILPQQHDERSDIFSTEAVAGSPTVGGNFLDLGTSVVSPVSRRARQFSQMQTFPSEPQSPLTSVVQPVQSSPDTTHGKPPASQPSPPKPSAPAVREAAAPAALQEVTITECDAAIPLPIRMPDSGITQIVLEDCFSNIERIADTNRLSATRIVDGMNVSIRVHDVTAFSQLERNEFLRDAYAMIVVTQQHPHLVRHVDAFISDDRLYIIQERMKKPHVTLLRYVQDHGLIEGEQALRTLMQLADALHWIHFHGQPHMKINDRNIYAIERPGSSSSNGLPLFDIKISSFRVLPNAQIPATVFADDIRDAGMLMRKVMSTNVSETVKDLTAAMCNLSPKERPSTAWILALLAKRSILEILETTNIPVVATDRKGRILAWNLAAELLFEYPAAEVVGKHNITILMRGEMAKQHVRWMKEYRVTHVKHQVDNSQIVGCWTRSNRLISVEMRISERSNGSFLAIFRDVSPVHSLKIHHHLRMMNAVIIDYIPVPLVSIDDCGTIVEFNRAAAEMFGFHPGEVRKQNVGILMPPDIARHHDEFLQRYDQRTQPSRVVGTTRTVLCRHRSGQLFPARLYVVESKSKGITPPTSMASLRVKSGEATPSSHVDPSREATPEAATLEEVAALEKDTPPRFCGYFTQESNFYGDLNNGIASAADSMLCGVIAADEYGLIRRMNRMAEEIFEWKEYELLGKNVRVLMEDEVASVHQQYIERFKKFGASDRLGVPRQVTALTKQGASVRVRICVQPAYRNERLWFTALVMLDIADTSSAAQLRRTSLEAALQSYGFPPPNASATEPPSLMGTQNNIDIGDAQQLGAADPGAAEGLMISESLVGAASRRSVRAPTVAPSASDIQPCQLYAHQ